MPDTVLGVTRSGPVATIELTRGRSTPSTSSCSKTSAPPSRTSNTTPRSVPSSLPGRAASFSAGVDLRMVIDSEPPYAGRLVEALRVGLEALFGFPKPTVAAVNGAAVAGGCILACACDRRLMAEHARIGATELAVGVPFPVAVLEVLRHACGSHTEDLVFTARLLDVQTRRTRWAWSTRCCPATSCSSAPAMTVATDLATLTPLAYRLAKQQLRRPAFERMRSDAAVDADAIGEWGAPHTAERLREQLDRLAASR